MRVQESTMDPFLNAHQIPGVSIAGIITEQGVTSFRQANVCSLNFLIIHILLNFRSCFSTLSLFTLWSKLRFSPYHFLIPIPHPSSKLPSFLDLRSITFALVLCSPYEPQCQESFSHSPLLFAPTPTLFPTTYSHIHSSHSLSHAHGRHRFPPVSVLFFWILHRNMCLWFCTNGWKASETK